MCQLLNEYKIRRILLSHPYFCIRWESEKKTQTKESGRTKKANNIGSSTVCDILIFIFCFVGMTKRIRGTKCLLVFE